MKETNYQYIYKYNFFSSNNMRKRFQFSISPVSCTLKIFKFIFNTEITGSCMPILIVAEIFYIKTLCVFVYYSLPATIYIFSAILRYPDSRLTTSIHDKISFFKQLKNICKQFHMVFYIYGSRYIIKSF